MNKILAVVVADDDHVAGVLAGEALRGAAASRHHAIDVEVCAKNTVISPLDPRTADPRDVLLLVASGDVEERRFAQNPREKASIADVLADPGAVIDRLGRMLAAEQPVTTRIVAITSCPTGIAHTFMAAEGLEKGAAELGVSIRVETQGSVGAENALTPDEIAAADIVLIAADREVDRGRFGGKRVFVSGTKPAISGGKALIERALAGATLQAPAAAAAVVAPVRPERAGPYKHLMNGVSFMLPFVIAGGLLIALAFAFGGIYASKESGTFANALFQIGAKAAFILFVPALAGYIAYSIADRPGLAPGMIGGVLAVNLGAGFLGGIAAGFIAGYGVDAFNRWIRLPKNLAGLKPVLILPVLGALLTGLVMIYVVGGPVAHVLAFLTAWLRGMQGSSAILLGALLGAMMAFDLGGPVNKAAYAFSTGLLSSEVYTPMAATMVAGMTPPLAIALATKLFANRFTTDEREAGNAAAVLGLAFISEGAIPFAARDPFRVIPSLMAGSAVAGAISMGVGAELHVPHGGIFVLPIPGAVSHLLGYLAALVAGTVVSALILAVVKRPVASNTAPSVARVGQAAAAILVAASFVAFARPAFAQSAAPAPASPVTASATPTPAPPTSAFTPLLNYTGEAAANPSGGLRNGSAFAGQVLMGFDLDMERLVHATGGTLHFVVTNRHGENLASTSIGNNTSVQEIYGTQNTHLALFTWEQKLEHGRLDIEAGRIPANISFLNSPYYCAFQDNAVCGNPTFVFKTSNFTYWPASSWGLHAKQWLSDRTYLHVGAYEVNPDRKTARDNGFTFNTDHATGVITPFEFGYSTTFKNDRLPRNYRIGGWYDSGEYADPLLDSAGGIAGLTGRPAAVLRGRSGAFVRFDQMVSRPDATKERGLTLFGVGMAGLSGRLPEDHFVELGVVQTGTFARRDADTLGFVVSDQHFTNLYLDGIRAARVSRGASPHIPTHETSMVLSYGAQVTPAIRISPSVQYIINPDQGSVPFRTTNIPNTFVVGLKFTVDVPTLASAHPRSR